MTLTTGAMYLKRGYTSDPEDGRMTNRLQIARGILAAQGIEPTKAHAGPYADEPRLFHEHLNRFCGDRCRTAWPEEATDEVLSAAFALADAIQNARYARTTRSINEAEMARMAAR